MRKGSGTALSDKIKYLGVSCGKRAGPVHRPPPETGPAGRERDARCSRLTEEGAPAADPTNLEPCFGERSHRNLSLAGRLVTLATGAKE